MNKTKKATPGKRNITVWIQPTMILFFLMLCGSALGAQAVPSATAAPEQNLPRVFIDCPDCDIGYFRDQIKFVDHVQSLGSAQVLVLVTSQETETGGREYTLSFKGQKDFQGDDDTLKYVAEKEEDVKKRLSDTLKMGLMRYVGKTPVSDKISIRFLDTVKPTAVEDKWNFWVFSISTDTFLNGQESYKSGMYFGSLSANRVTEELKIQMSVNGMLNKDIFTYEGEDIESESHSMSFNGLVVKSISEHWSVGAYFSADSSTYSNIAYAFNPSPAVEFNLFPYSESTKRELRFLYKLGFAAVKYREETIYEKTRENLWNQSLSAILDIKQPWGTLSASLTGSHFLHDFSKNRLRFSTDLSLRILKGLRFNVDVSYSIVHDQLSLPRLGASLEEILLQRSELETTYNYWISVGISYTFGSVHSNVVNPRFGDGGGGIYISF